MFTILATLLSILFFVALAMFVWEAGMQAILFLVLNPVVILMLIIVSVIAILF